MAQLSTRLDFTQMLTKWASILNPLLSNPINNVQILKDVSLVVGTNVINHKLGKKQSGWFLVDIQGAATIYRNGEFNDLTLSLDSSAAVIVSIGVY